MTAQHYMLAWLLYDFQGIWNSSHLFCYISGVYVSDPLPPPPPPLDPHIFYIVGLVQHNTPVKERFSTTVGEPVWSFLLSLRALFLYLDGSTQPMFWRRMNVLIAPWYNSQRYNLRYYMIYACPKCFCFTNVKSFQFYLALLSKWL